jgi:signal transduction histidine kinase
MINISKQFEELAINFKSNYFLKARLKLSAYYASGMFIVVLIFSLVVYSLFVKNISDNFESDGSGNNESSVAENRAIENAKNQLQDILIFVDGLTIILTIASGYYLAGRTLEPIKKVYIKQKKFVADSAHELRTPLTVMKTGAETILAGNSSKEDYVKLTQDSLEEINFMSSMVSDLLFLAQSDGFKKKEFNKLDLGKITQTQIDLMKTYAGHKNIALKSHVEGKFFISGDGTHLKRLSSNLIKNAIDYNKSNGAVDVSLEESKNQVVLKVIDTGIGIPKENLNRIFDRFYKVDQARARESSGTGLGLAIVKEIVNAHKGKIEIISEVGKGTEVKVFLPKVRL